MDIIWWAFIFGTALIIFATIFNSLFAEKEKKAPGRFFAHFVEEYGFSLNNDASIFNGLFAQRQFQLRKDPFSAFTQITNPKGIRLLIEKGVHPPFEDLVLVKYKPEVFKDDIVIRSNYAPLVPKLISDELVKELIALPQGFALELREGGVLLHFAKDLKLWVAESAMHSVVRFARDFECLSLLEKK